LESYVRKILKTERPSGRAGPERRLESTVRKGQKGRRKRRWINKIHLEGVWIPGRESGTM
jgi:hypothetical protein